MKYNASDWQKIKAGLILHWQIGCTDEHCEICHLVHQQTGKFPDEKAYMKDNPNPLPTLASFRGIMRNERSTT